MPGTPRTLELPDGRSARIVVESSGGEVVLFGPDGQSLPSGGPAAPFDVYVPYTKRHAHTAAGAPANAVWVDVSTSPHAYYVALLDWWSRGETLMVVEHDVVVRPDVIDELDACPEPWCVYEYDDFCHRECREGWRNLLGCTRFRSELVRAVPDAVASIPPDNWDWHNVCDGVGGNLRGAGYTHHWHEPPVNHRRG